MGLGEGSVHHSVGEVLVARDMDDARCGKSPEQLQRPGMQRLEFQLLHPVRAEYLLDQEFGVAPHLQFGRVERCSQFQTGQESAVLGLVVGGAVEMFGKLCLPPAAAVDYQRAYAGRPRVRPGATVDVEN